MAGAKKKGKKNARKGPDYRVVLYNPGAETPQGAAVRAVLKELGVPVRTVGPDQLGDPVGAVAGLVGFRPALRPYAGPVPSCPFMLLCNLPNALLDQLLSALREADASVGCKAVLTKFNKSWEFAQLVAAVQREHEDATAPSPVQEAEGAVE